MKKKIILLIAISVIGVFTFLQNTMRFAEAAGGFEITYLGDDLSGPIFDIHGMLPGDCFTREIVAKNNGSSSTELSVRSTNEIDTQNLSTQIDFVVKSGATTYFSNTLKNFYNTNSVSLGTLAGNQEKTYEFNACFKTSAGNEFQGTETKFNLVFSTKHGGSTPQPHEVPEECKHLKIEKFIIGNSGNNHLTGSSKKEFIDGQGGNDHIEGASDNDCLVGGAGNDKIEGGSGEDVIIGNEGNDDLRGDSGNDRIFGNNGNDQLRGGSGSDYLDGGANNDTAHGESGTDTCVNDETKSSCELP